MERYMYGTCGECIKDKIYMYLNKFNAILEMDVNNGNKRLLYGRRSEAGQNIVENLSSSSVLWGNWIIFLPRNSSTLFLLNTDTLERKEFDIGVKGNYFWPVLIEDRLFMLPSYHIDKIPCFNLNENKMEWFDFGYKALFEQIDRALFARACYVNRKVYRSCREGPFINVIDVEKKISRWIQVNDFDQGIRDTAFDGEAFYLKSQDGKIIVKWNEKKNKIECEMRLHEFIGEEDGIYGMFLFMGKLYLTFLRNYNMLVLDENLRLWKKYNFGEYIKGNSNEIMMPFSEHPIMAKNKFYLLPNRNYPFIVEINENSEIKLWNTEISVEEIYSVMGNVKIANEYMSSLDVFLNCVETNEHISQQHKCVGSEIWRTIFKG